MLWIVNQSCMTTNVQRPAQTLLVTVLSQPLYARLTCLSFTLLLSKSTKSMATAPFIRTNTWPYAHTLCIDTHHVSKVIYRQAQVQLKLFALVFGDSCLPAVHYSISLNFHSNQTISFPSKLLRRPSTHLLNKQTFYLPLSK